MLEVCENGVGKEFPLMKKNGVSSGNEGVRGNCGVRKEKCGEGNGYAGD